jgi:hypothetical protein
MDDLVSPGEIRVMGNLNITERVTSTGLITIDESANKTRFNAIDPVPTHSALTSGIHGATATKTASRIPIADSNGLLNNWRMAAATSATTGTMTVNMNNSNVITITPTGHCTFNASGGVAGNRVTFIITTSGVNSYNMTFNTNFKSQGVLATGTTTAKTFTITFACKDGTTWCEVARTTAM